MPLVWGEVCRGGYLKDDIVQVKFERIGATDGAPFGFHMTDEQRDAYWIHLLPMFKAFNAYPTKEDVLNLREDHENALTVWLKTHIKVIYDDTLPVSDKYFALAHELGYIALNHSVRFAGTKGLYHVMEQEAEVLAYGLLNIISRLEGFTR